MKLVEPERALLAGDWHGHAKWALLVIEYAHAHGAQAIVQLGDFGYWLSHDCPGGVDIPGLRGTWPTETLAAAERRSRSSKTLRYFDVLQESLSAKDMTLYWLDGNHEDHSRLSPMQHAEHPWVTNNFDRIIYLPRGYRWEWWGKTWMSVGGAVSIDRNWRVEGYTWWPEEELTDTDVEYASRGSNVDIVLSHDCPGGVDIPGLRGTWPTETLAAAERHRGKLERVWSATHPDYWYHGHYHVPYEAKVGGTVFTGLGCDGDNPIEKTVRLLCPTSF